MTRPLSALDYDPIELVEEVSLAAINFYEHQLDSLFLPTDFRTKNAETVGVHYWSPEQRLTGKFGRFVISHLDGEEIDPSELVLMGSTIGVSGMAENGRMQSLQHATLKEAAWQKLAFKHMDTSLITVTAADYGAYSIWRNPEDGTGALLIAGKSDEYGRANTAGRKYTCDLIAKLLKDELNIANIDGEPTNPEDVMIDGNIA